MLTVNYLRVIGCKHDAAKRNGAKWQEEAYEGLLMYKLI